jgi:hypothetical protein
MNQIIMIFLGIWFVFLIVIIGYWGNLAWVHPDRLKQRLKQYAQRGPDRLLVMRVVTLIGAISIIVLIIMFLLSFTT